MAIFRDPPGSADITLEDGEVSAAGVLVDAPNGNSGSAPTTGITVVPGTGFTDLGIHVDMTAGGKTGIRVSARGGNQFMAFHEYFQNEDTGVWEDNGPSHVISGGGMETWKWFMTTGQFFDNGLARSDPGFIRSFIAASDRNASGPITSFAGTSTAQRDPSMISVRCDVPTGIEIRPTVTETGCFALSFRDRDLAFERGGFDENADLVYGPGCWAIPQFAGEPGRETHDVKMGRSSPRTWGMKEGALKIRAYELADAPYALECGDYALIAITDATTPGLHVSLDGQWYPIAHGETGVGTFPPGYTWTVAYFYTGGGGGAIALSGARTLEKTAGTEDWLDAAYSSDSLTGDQILEFTVPNSGFQRMIGLTDEASPLASSAWEQMDYGVYSASGVLFSVAGGTIDFSGSRGEIGPDVRWALKYEGTTVSLLRNGSPTGAGWTTTAGRTFRPFFGFNDVGGIVSDIRWTAL